MHPPESETIHHEPDIEFRSFVGAEVIGHAKADAVSKHVVYSSFVPLDLIFASEKDVISNYNRGSAFQKTLNSQSESE